MKFERMGFHRRSMRLEGYDYSQTGAYYVTMVTQGREFLFGKIENSEMILNEAGTMIAKWWRELPNKFPAIELGGFVVMPDHFHGIIQITGAERADLRVCPEEDSSQEGGHAGPPQQPPQRGGHVGPPQQPSQRLKAPLSQMIQWFKTMTTNEYIRGVKKYGWRPFKGKLWQRNYYEHIIRNEMEWDRIQRYIEANPIRWKSDKEHSLNI